MKGRKKKKIDLSRKRIAYIADTYYNRGDYLTALRFAHRELKETGGDPDVFVRLCDIYEAMGLHGSAINYWFRYLDVAHQDDLSDIYEGLATNYFAIGNERASSYYYNRLVDADDTIPEEAKMEIAAAFSKDKKENFRFVYPPKLADYSKELTRASSALKSGDAKNAIRILDVVAEGSKDYISAKEMQAVSHLLLGEVEIAETICKELLELDPTQVRVVATLSAVYLEEGKTEEALELAKRLTQMKVEADDDLYKVATVCCENGLHAEAFERFAKLNERTPNDGRILYFKAVSAYKSGKLVEAERALDTLVTVYPDAEVAKYYLREIRAYRKELAQGENPPAPELIYFYHLPQEEREHRCRALIKIGGSPKDEARLFGLLALHDGYFAWCFDEMDGGDRDLQYLGLVTANHVRADEFLQDVLLDYEVADVLKIEVLRMLAERNEDMDVGIVISSLYREVLLNRIQIGRKRRKKFLGGYARVTSKLNLVKEEYAEKLQKAAEELYRALEAANALDLVDSEDDLACAIYFRSGLQELGKDQEWIARAFDGNLAKVRVLLSYAVYQNYANEEKKDEAH